MQMANHLHYAKPNRFVTASSKIARGNKGKANSKKSDGGTFGCLKSTFQKAQFENG